MKIAEITLINGYILIGPKINLILARKLAKEIDQEMNAVYKEFEDEGESLAMDERDNVFFEHKEKFLDLGFELKEN